MICTSIPLRTSTKVSLGFILAHRRSLPLGYTLRRSTALAPRAEAQGQRAALREEGVAALAPSLARCIRARGSAPRGTAHRAGDLLSLRVRGYLAPRRPGACGGLPSTRGGV